MRFLFLNIYYDSNLLLNLRRNSLTNYPNVRIKLFSSYFEGLTFVPKKNVFKKKQSDWPVTNTGNYHFPLELHNNSFRFGGYLFFTGYGWAFKLYFSLKNELSTKKKKDHWLYQFMGLLRRQKVTSSESAFIKNWNFEIPLHLCLAPANANRNIHFFKTILRLNTNIFFFKLDL